VNQLLDGSVSLSPLSPGLTNDLHVSNATNFHQGFPWLGPTQGKFTIFRVQAYVLYLSPISDEPQGGAVLQHELLVNEGGTTLSPRPFRQRRVWDEPATICKRVETPANM